MLNSAAWLPMNGQLVGVTEGRTAWVLELGLALAEALNWCLWLAAHVGVRWLLWLPALLRA